MSGKKQTLVLNCASGISGDMTVAALLDLGADEKVLLETLKTLPLEGAEVKISRVIKSGLDACDFDVILDAEHENHDHDMAYLHPDRAELHDHGHEHHHDHEHDHHGHHHHGRNLADITKILKAGSMTPRALELALKIFGIVAEAEAKVHGKPLDEVHFHEVGAVDSIIDIAAAAICIDNLGITDCIITDLTEGTGTVMCQHGLLPIPVPATTEILRRHAIPFRVASGVWGELITPTGAAIAAALRTGDKLPETFTILRTGLGAGKRDYAVTGVVRAMLIGEAGRADTAGTSAASDTNDTVELLQTNVDDCSAEALGFVLEELFAAGALDAYFVPIFMKKNRPAYMLCVLCSEADREKMEETIFRHTTAIGIRRIRCDRTKLERKSCSIQTPWGNADVKICKGPDGEQAFPEAESVARLARRSGIGFTQMYHRIKTLAQEPTLQ